MNTALEELDWDSALAEKTKPALNPDDLPFPASPFRGIKPFRLLDWRLFLERERETEEVENRMVMYRALLVYGRSGTGKSSLLNAGLMPHALRRNMAPERLRILPEPGREIAVERISWQEKHPSVAGHGQMSNYLPSRFSAADADDRKILSCADFLTTLRKADPKLGEPLLLFDQFEELVTLFEEGAADSERWKKAKQARAAIESLLTELLLHEKKPLKIVFSFRDDYLARLTPFFERFPNLLDQTVRLEALRLDRLERIVLGPFERVGGADTPPESWNHPPLTKPLAKKIVEGFRELSPSGLLALSEVQTLCLALWEKKSLREELLKAEKPAPTIRKIIEKDAWAKFDQFHPLERAQAFALLASLVTEQGTRNVIAKESLLKEARRNVVLPLHKAAIEKVLDRMYKETGLLRRSASSGTVYYELTNEFLIPWIQNAQRKLNQLRRLVAIYAWGFLVAVAVALGFFWWAAERQKARAEEAETVAERTTQENLQLLAANNALIAQLREKQAAETEPDEAREKALRELALRLNSSTSVALSGPTQELVNAQVALNEAKLGDPGAPPVELPHTDEVWKAVFSADGKKLATASADRFVKLWTTDGQAIVNWEASSSKGGVTDVAIDPAGRFLISGSAGRSVRAFDLTKQAQVGDVLEQQADTITAVAFSPDGNMAVSASADRSVFLWPLEPLRQGKKSVAPLAKWKHKGIVMGASFSPDGKFVVTSCDDGFLRIWNAMSPAEPPKQWFADAPVRNAAFSPDAGFVVATAGKRVLLWDTKNESPRRQDLSVAPIHVVFSPDGQRIAVATADGALALWNPSAQPGSPDISHLQAQQRGRILRLGWSVRNVLAGASEDGTVQLWENPGSGASPTTFQAHKGPVWWLCFSPDGEQLVTTSAFSDENLPTARGQAAETGKSLSRLPDNVARLWKKPALKPANP